LRQQGVASKRLRQQLFLLTSETFYSLFHSYCNMKLFKKQFMKKYLIILSLLISFRASSQVPEWQWAQSSAFADSTGTGEGWNVATDVFGNAYVAGFFYFTSLSFGSYTLSPVPSPMGLTYATMCVAKYDSSGNVLWAKGAGGLGESKAYDVTADASGNVYVTGEFNSNYITFDSDTLDCVLNGKSIFLVKYDPSGNVVWARSAGEATGHPLSNKVIVDPSGAVYISGYFESPTITFGSVVLSNAGFQDIFIAKYDANGNVIWAKREGYTGLEITYGMTSDPAGNTYITGFYGQFTGIFGNDTLSSAGSADVFIAKYDPAGNELWAKSGGGVGQDVGKSVAVSDNGNVYVTGYFWSPSVTFGSFTLTGTGTNNTFLVKYDAAGTVLWAKSFHETIPYNMVADTMQNIYMSGAMYSDISFDTVALQIPANSNDAMFIVKCDSSGTALWAKALQSGGDDDNGFALGTNGSIYTGGDFYNVNPFIIGNDSLFQFTSTENLFIAKLGYSTATGIPEINTNENMILYPDPFRDRLTVSVNSNNVSEIILYDIASRKLVQKEFTSSTTLNTAQLAKGIYIYEVRSNLDSNQPTLIKQGKVVKE
jgi:hypothetical protein